MESVPLVRTGFPVGRFLSFLTVLLTSITVFSTINTFVSAGTLYVPPPHIQLARRDSTAPVTFVLKNTYVVRFKENSGTDVHKSFENALNSAKLNWTKRFEFNQLFSGTSLIALSAYEAVILNLPMVDSVW